MARKPPKPPRSIREDAINLPNLLTMARVVMIPLVLWLLADGTREASFWAAMVYILLTITDALDGWLARRQNLISVLGQFLDPLADKLLVITALRTIAMSEGVVISAGQGGKEKTALQMVAILLLMLHHPYEVDFFFFQVPVALHDAGLVLLYLSLFFAITSAGEYIALFVEAVEAKERRLKEGLEPDE